MSHAMNDESISRELLAAISDALIFADTEGVIRQWNAGAESLFGFAAGEALGQRLDIIIPESLRDAHWHGFARAIEQGRTAHAGRPTLTRALHKDGSKLFVEMSFAVVTSQAGEVRGSLAIARDATERTLEQKRMRQQLADMGADPPGSGGSD